MHSSDRATWLARPPQDALARKLRLAAWILSAVVLLLVFVMQKARIPLPEGWSTALLPPIHAGINTAGAIVLLLGLIFVKTGNIRLHRAMMVAAMGLSVLFLLSYVAYHFTNDPVRYPADAPMRGLYLILLITHIILAAVSLPFILFTFIAGWTNQFAAHRKLARWVFPMWLYVAITGPVCYWMLRPYY
jgi:putative membrane protein